MAIPTQDSSKTVISMVKATTNGKMEALISANSSKAKDKAKAPGKAAMVTFSKASTTMI